MGLPELIKNLTEDFGELEIIKHGNKIYTFNKLNNRSNQIGNALLSLGVHKGEKFGILLYNSPEYVEIIVGLQKIGAIPVPLNHRYGLMELKYINEDADLNGIFIDYNFMHFFTGVDFKNINFIFVLNSPLNEKLEDMYNYEKFILDRENTDPNIQISDDDIGIIIYTGGTTGNPKGVMLTHSNLMSAVYLGPEYVMNLIEEEQIPETTFFPPDGMRFLIPTSIAHTSGFMPVITQIGMHNLMVFPISPSFIPEEICQIIQDEKITSMIMVPSMYKIWLDYCNNYGFDKFDLSSLTLLSSGGSKLSKQMKIELLQKFPQATILDGYGSTETMGATTIDIITKEDISTLKEGSIGKIIEGIDMKIVDEKGEEVPIGRVGQIKSKSSSIMQGYYRDEIKTKSVLDKDGWLASGDLAKRDKNGNVIFLGRKKYLINSGAEKIYPEEVEDFLKQHPKIEEVGVTGIPNDVWGETVTVLIELKPEENMTSEEVQEFCSGKIAKYKKPRHVFFIEKIPTTKAVGKIDRIKIREMALSLYNEIRTVSKEVKESIQSEKEL